MRRLGALGVWAPVVVLTVWGASYVYACFLTLSAGGVPVQYTYESPGGNLVLRAESYHFDLPQNVLKLDGISIKDAAGVLQASVRRLLLRDLIPGRRPILAEGADVFARVERKRDGRFRLEDFLPQGPPSESTQAYSARLDRVSVLYVDYTTPTAWRRWVSSRRVNVDGVGPEWVAAAPLKIEGTGNAEVRLRAAPVSGIELRFQTFQMEVAPILNRLAASPDGKGLPELRSVFLTSGLVTADGRISLPPAPAKPAWYANLVGKVRGFAYANEVRFSSAAVFATVGAEGIRGQIQGEGDGSTTEFDGTIRWKDRTTLAGALKVSAARVASLPTFLRRQVPKSFSFGNGRLSGWLSYEDTTGVKVTGDVTVATARWEDQSAHNLAGQIDVDDRRFLASGAHGMWEGAPVSGALAYDLKTGALDGHVQSSRVQLAPVVRRFGLKAIDGIASVRVILDGKLSAPELTIRAEGQGTSREQGITVRLGRFELGGTYRAEHIDIDRFTVVGPSGSATANGIWDVRNNKVDIDVLATGVPLQSFIDDVRGSAAFAGKIAGTPKTVVAEGRLEVFDALIAGQELPFARGDVRIDKVGLKAQKVLAFKKGAQARGFAGVTFKDRRLSGEFAIEGLDLADYQPDAISGIARVPKGTLKGTLDDPILEADVDAENVVAFGVSVDKVDASASIRKGVLNVEHAEARSEGGVVEASGSLEMGKRTGTFSLEAKNLPLRTLLAQVLKDVTVQGLLSGTMKGVFGDGKFQQVDADTQLTAFQVNDAFLGNGPVSLKSDGSKWNGTLFLGDLASYLQIPNLEYDANSGALEGTVAADNFKADVVYDSFKRYLTRESGESLLPDDVRDHLDSFKGQIDLDARVSGLAKEPAVDVQALVMDQMLIGGQNAGRLEAKGSRKDRIWSIDQFLWTGGPAFVKLNRGRIDERGDTDIDGEVKNFRWKWFAPFRSEYGKVDGLSDLPFLVKGKTSSPEIEASFSYEEGSPIARFVPWPGVELSVRNPKARTRRIDLDRVSVKEGSIQAGGAFNVEGFTGTIDALVPFKYPFEIPDREPISAVAKISDRPLTSLQELFPWLDAKRTTGAVSGLVQLGGTRSEMQLRGDLTANAPSLGIRDLQTSFKDLSFSAGFTNENVFVKAQGKGSAGGSFETEDVGFSLGNLEDAFRESFAVLLQNRLFGNFRLDQLKLDYLDAQNGPMTTTVSGSLGLGGTLEKPAIGGQLLLSGADLAVPTVTVTEGATPNFPIDPTFDVSFLTTNNIRLRAATGRFELSGGGRLEGTLSSPQFASTLEVESGSLRLPNARIVIEPGGTVIITYRAGATGNTVSRVEVDLTGRTQVTAESFAGIVERYDVILNMRGDLLADNGLRLSAQSDPPDLSQDRILGILGQRDVFAGQAGEGFRADRQLQSALLGIAVPYLAGGFTERLASSLGLDYLNVEYNSFDQFAVTAAVSLGKDFILSGRRQLSSPVPGQKPKYDVRLSYRPRFRNKALRRFTFSIGMDQDRPWKISVEYGIRF